MSIKTACHKEGGCIRAYEDDTCGEEGQCSIVLACIAAKNEGLELASEVAEGLADAHDGAAIRAAEEVDVVENRAAESALRSFAVAIRNRMQEPRQ